MPPGNRTSFNEMWQRWQAVSNTVPNLNGRHLNLRCSILKAFTLPLVQLAGTVANHVLYIFCSNCCHSCCRTDNCNNDPCFDNSGIPPTPGLATTSRIPGFPRPRPSFKRCLQGQRILLNGIEISNTLQLSRCPDPSQICHRYDITALENGQRSKKCVPEKLKTNKLSSGGVIMQHIAIINTVYKFFKTNNN